jgi:hypothetical protein
VAEDDFSAGSGVETSAAASTEVERGIHLGSLGTLLILLVGNKGSDSKAYCEACGSKRSERQPLELERSSEVVLGVEVTIREQQCCVCPTPLRRPVCQSRNR